MSQNTIQSVSDSSTMSGLTNRSSSSGPDIVHGHSAKLTKKSETHQPDKNSLTNALSSLLISTERKTKTEESFRYSSLSRFTILNLHHLHQLNPLSKNSPNFNHFSRHQKCWTFSSINLSHLRQDSLFSSPSQDTGSVFIVIILFKRSTSLSLQKLRKFQSHKFPFPLFISPQNRQHGEHLEIVDIDWYELVKDGPTIVMYHNDLSPPSVYLLPNEEQLAKA